MKPRAYPTHYGFTTARKMSPWEIEGYAYLHRPEGLTDRYTAFVRYLQARWPQYRENLNFNPWMQRILRALTEDRYAIRRGDLELRFINLTGCASASKTHTAGVFASCWWELDPLNSAVALTSTTKKAMAQRMWPVIQEMYQTRVNPDTGARETVGNLLNSQHCWQAEKGDDKHSILCQAVESGDINDAVENIKGQHTPRRLIVVDECNTTPEAIFAAIPNARKGCRELIVLSIGNAVSKLDMHGAMCEPKNGWNSVKVEDEEWRTQGVKRYQIESGWCLHFDGRNSPNVKAGKTIWPYLYTLEDWQAGQAGDTEYRNGIWFWSNDRGFWPADDLKQTVLTETMLDRYDGYGREPFVFYGPVTNIAGFDPGKFNPFGDEAVLRFGRMGKLENGQLGVMLTRKVSLEVSATSKEPVEYQLARQIRALCEEEHVEPTGFGLDATGTGRGTWAVMYNDWSADIVKVEFGGSASKMPASEEDFRPADVVYDNCVTELWFNVKSAVCGGVLRGINRDEAIEFCGREYTIKSKRYQVVPKDECKARIRRSPDNADACAVLIRVAKLKGLIGGATPQDRPPDAKWDRFAERAHAMYEQDEQYREAAVED